MVDGLFAVLVTLGVVPYIRCPRGGAAEMVATHLNKRLADHLVRALASLATLPRRRCSDDTTPDAVCAHCTYIQ
jgi:hypothetical protein